MLLDLLGIVITTRTRKSFDAYETISKLERLTLEELEKVELASCELFKLKVTKMCRIGGAEYQIK